MSFLAGECFLGVGTMPVVLQTAFRGSLLAGSEDHVCCQRERESERALAPAALPLQPLAEYVLIITERPAALLVALDVRVRGSA